MTIEWGSPLRTRRGGASRLSGLRVHYDFVWESVFGHGRATFPGGQSLAELVRRECPAGKGAALLLTTRNDVRQPYIVETDDQYVAVVPIHDYLQSASGGDTASTYYARLSPRPLTQLPSLSEITTFTVGELETFLDAHLTAELIAAWIDRSIDPESILAFLGAEAGPNPDNVARILSADDTGFAQELARRLEAGANPTPIRRVLLALTEQQTGRTAAYDVLGDRLPERIADTRLKLEEYEALIARPTTTETEVQRFIEVNPWMVGLPYHTARPRVPIARGVLDFVLDRFDGFFDLVELKGPSESIVVEPSLATQRPPSASEYSLSRALSNALAQAHHYRGLLDRSADLASEYGLADTRQPRILILIGRSESLSDSGREILRQLNLSLHRVEVIPYDVLGRRTAGLLENVEVLWNASEVVSEEQAGPGGAP